MTVFHNMSSEDFDKVKNIDRQLSGNPNSLELLMKKAFVYYHAYYDEKAIETFQKIIDLYPDYIDAYFLLAFYLFRIAVYPFRAIETAKKGLMIQPDHVGLYTVLAQATKMAGTEECLRYYLEKAIMLDPTWMTSWLTLIEYLIDNNELVEAKSKIKQAFKYIPDQELSSDDEVEEEYYYIAFQHDPEAVEKALQGYIDKIEKLELKK